MRRLNRYEYDNTIPTCAACHRLIDPIGFGLENFDVLGRWRSEEGDNPIDPSGVMPNGASFSGPAELRQVLLERKEAFVRTLCERLLGFALGSSLVDQDQCTVEQLRTRLKENDYRIRSLIDEIVLSVPFQCRQGIGSSGAEGAADPSRPETPDPTPTEAVKNDRSDNAQPTSGETDD